MLEWEKKESHSDISLFEKSDEILKKYQVKTWAELLKIPGIKQDKEVKKVWHTARIVLLGI